MEENLYSLSWEERQVKWEEMQRTGWACNRRSGLWEADHIQAVVEGGGMHGLENYRTLCVPCHKKETALLRKRMAVARRKGVTLDVVDHLECTCSCPEGTTCLDCICHWRHDGPEQISESKRPASYWEGKGVQQAELLALAAKAIEHKDDPLPANWAERAAVHEAEEGCRIDRELAAPPPVTPAPPAPAKAPEKAGEGPPSVEENRRRLMAANALLLGLFK
jgi:hypothetical protein